MPRKKIDNKEIEEKVRIIVDSSVFSLTIREVTLRLKEKYNIGLSPQVVKRHLFKLKKEGKIK